MIDHLHYAFNYEVQQVVQTRSECVDESVSIPLNLMDERDHGLLVQYTKPRGSTGLP